MSSQQLQPQIESQEGTFKEESFERKVVLSDKNIVLFRSTVQTEKKPTKSTVTATQVNAANPYEIRVVNSMKKSDSNQIERILVIDTCKQKITFIDHYLLQQETDLKVKCEDISSEQRDGVTQQEQQQLQLDQFQQYKQQQQQQNQLIIEQQQQQYQQLQQVHLKQQQQILQKFQLELQQQLHIARSDFEQEKQLMIQKFQLQMYQQNVIAEAKTRRIVELEGQLGKINEECNGQKEILQQQLEQKSGEINILQFNIKQSNEKFQELEKQLKFYTQVNDNLRESMQSLMHRGNYSVESPPSNTQLSRYTQQYETQQNESAYQSDSDSDQNNHHHIQQQSQLPKRKHKISKQQQQQQPSLMSNSSFKAHSICSSSSNFSEPSEKTTNITIYANKGDLIRKNAKYFVNQFYLFLNNSPEAQRVIAETNPELNEGSFDAIIQEFNFQHTQKTLDRKALMNLVCHSNISKTFYFFLVNKAANQINISNAKNKDALLRTLEVIIQLFPKQLLNDQKKILGKNNNNTQQQQQGIKLTFSSNNESLNSQEMTTHNHID